MVSVLHHGLNRFLKPALVAGLLLTTAACQVSEFAEEKHLLPVDAKLQRKMERSQMELKAPILVRIFKEESELEIWKETKSGRYALLETYDICKWSGELGPKFKEGDRQAPEGFYEVTRGLMNPNSNYYLSFNLGFPNKYDRAHDRTGSHLMVHGACSSRGCYAMTDEQVGDIYALARDAFMGGQRKFQVQAFPFRMTGENMARHADSEHFEFWKMLKEGHDHFEVTNRPPTIDVCEGRYVFNAQTTSRSAPFDARGACPSYQVPEEIAVAVAQKNAADMQSFEEFQIAAERRRQREEALASLIGPNKKAEEANSVALESALALTSDQNTAATPEEKKSPTNYFSRFFPIKEASLAEGIPSTMPVPASKP